MKSCKQGITWLVASREDYEHKGNVDEIATITNTSLTRVLEQIHRDFATKHHRPTENDEQNEASLENKDFFIYDFICHTS
jgi:hypothetical protein